MSFSNIKPIILRGFSVALRLIFVIFIPKILIEAEYNSYSLLNSLVVFVSSASGFGFPVLFIKKYTLGEVSKEFYLKYITPVSLVSGMVLYLLFVFMLPIQINGTILLLLLGITLSEVLILDFLRLFQSDSNVYKHIKVAFVKSLLMVVLFGIFYLLDLKATLAKVLFSWILSNLITVFYLNPKYKSILKYKSNQIVFTLPVVISSLLYFLSYLCDRFVLYYDKIFFFKNFDSKLLISLNLLIVITQSAYNLIESTILLKKYNNIFNNKYLLTKKELLELAFLVFMFSVLISSFLFFFYKQYFGSFEISIRIFFGTFGYFIIAILSWYYNIRNYSQFEPRIFVVLSFLAALIYLSLIFVNSLLIKSIYLIPALYPLSYVFVHKSARVVLLR